ncbi:MAG: hypothetical protein GX630_09510 [Actinobacteria bacterium]|nr:hypothetical protein [Actinomycetota bacterium]
MNTRTKSTAVLTPVAAIRANCLECCCGSAKAVRDCELASCRVHPYRMGRRPTPEERLAYEKRGTRLASFDADEDGEG